MMMMMQITIIIVTNWCSSLSLFVGFYSVRWTTSTTTPLTGPCWSSWTRRRTTWSRWTTGRRRSNTRRRLPRLSIRDGEWSGRSYGYMEEWRRFVEGVKEVWSVQERRRDDDDDNNRVWCVGIVRGSTRAEEGDRSAATETTETTTVDVGINNSNNIINNNNHC